MTPTQQKFVELERRKDEIKKFYDELKEANEALVKEIGIGGTFMDDQGIVFKTTLPEGRFIYYDKVSYVRTKRPGETRGTLSVKEAKELGYSIGE